MKNNQSDGGFEVGSSCEMQRTCRDQKYCIGHCKHRRAALAKDHAEHGDYELPSDPAQEPEAVATLIYTNWRGETSMRRIIPQSVRFGSTEWHPDPQWLLLAFDVEKQADREFALKDFGTRPVSLDREAIGRRLYDCEKQRGERAQSVMAAAYGKPCHGILMEPWDECKDSFLSDADAILALIEGRT